MPYAIVVLKPAAKELTDVPKKDREPIVTAIDALAENPRAHGVLKLTARENDYRLRVGAYRVIFSIDEEAKRVTVRHVGRRNERTY